LYYLCRRSFAIEEFLPCDRVLTSFEDRVRKLCHQALTVPESELEPILEELKQLVQLRTNDLRFFTVAVQENDKHAASGPLTTLKDTLWRLPKNVSLTAIQEKTS